MNRSEPLRLRHVFSTWWPLATSWGMMALELPVVMAVVARFDDPEIQLAAFGGVIFPVALIVESPIIMLLAASTALSRDWKSYLALRRFMHTAGFLLTVLHVLVAFTPLFDFVVGRLLNSPPEIWAPARLGLQIMTPWTWAIAYRRFNQGVLIRTGSARAIAVGTLIRFSTNAMMLLLGYRIGGVAGIAVGTLAIVVGVFSEAVFVGLRVRPVLAEKIRHAPPVEPLTGRRFARFYVPLALTSLLGLLIEPIGAAVLSRMPQAIESLAIWPVLIGVVFFTMSLGLAFNEVVVALLDRPNSFATLRRFTQILAVVTTTILILLVATPLSFRFFSGFSGLSPELALLASSSLAFALPLPSLVVLHSWYQGLLMSGHETRGIPESVGLFLVVAVVVCALGIHAVTSGWITAPGLYLVLFAQGAGSLVQAVWLVRRSRAIRERLQASGA